jgi:glycerol uptake facilitator-like aquaporin
LTDTFSGIRPSDVPGFIVSEIAGAVIAVVLFRWLLPNPVAINERERCARA